MLNKFTYYKTGGTCEKIFQPRNEAELASSLKEIHKQKIPFFLLGAGTNSLVMDQHWEGAVILFHHMKSISHKGEALICQAGVENTKIAQYALSLKLAGAGWMNRLPGQIGATVRMNARCYGGEISEIVRKVVCYDLTGHKIEYSITPSQKNVFKGYKDTIFMTNDQIISTIELQLQKGEYDTIKDKMNFCESDRNSKQQFNFPSCGCIFKNNYHPEVSVSSGLLLELAGAKKLLSKNCQVSPYHANFIFNTSNASSREILELSFKMREKVWEHFGVWLEYEMEILGNIPDDLKLNVSEHRQHEFNLSQLAKAKNQFKNIFNKT